MTDPDGVTRLPAQDRKDCGCDFAMMGGHEPECPASHGYRVNLVTMPADKLIKAMQEQLAALAAEVQRLTDNEGELLKRLSGITSHGSARTWDEVADAIQRLHAENDDWVEREAAVCPEDYGFDEYIGSLQERLFKAEADVQHLKDAQSWQPIETAPKDGTEILLTDGRYTRTGYWARRINAWSIDCVVSVGLPTHWIPLPKAEAEVQHLTAENKEAEETKGAGDD